MVDHSTPTNDIVLIRGEQNQLMGWIEAKNRGKLSRIPPTCSFPCVLSMVFPIVFENISRFQSTTSYLRLGYQGGYLGSLPLTKVK